MMVKECNGLAAPYNVVTWNGGAMSKGQDRYSYVPYF